MRRTFRFLVLLIAGLGVLTWLAMHFVNSTTRRWFERDLALRAQLAVQGSRRVMTALWQKQDWTDLRNVLVDLARDERIMAAAACDGAGATMVASTTEYPPSAGCRVAMVGMRAAGTSGASEWHSIMNLPDGRAHASAVPVREGERLLGFVLLLHDMTHVERREGTTTRFLLIAFVVLSLAAAAITLIAARLSWRSWSNEVRRLLRGGPAGADFAPLVGDLRELVAQIAAEKDSSDVVGGSWDPERVQRVISKQMDGGRVMVLANREPYIHERRPDGRIEVLHPASGLVTALEPVVRACSGVWIAHGSGSADRDMSDAQGRLMVPPNDHSYTLHRVWLPKDEEQGYYYGFSNEGLWPLCHIAHTRPLFRAEDWRHYQAANARFTVAACDESGTDDPIVLVQDYHFALAPLLIRQQLARATVIAFWHIPWPNAERFGICPWRNQLLEGLLGSSILGFQTQLHCNNFLDSVERYLEARVDREDDAVVFQRRRTLVRPYPISIEWPSRAAAEAPPVQLCRAEVRAGLGLRPDALIGVGVDRLDYTKGIEERFLAVEALLDRFPEYRGRFSFVQLAAPSRIAIERYRYLNEQVENLCARINTRFAQPDGYRPIVLLRAHHEQDEIFRYYRAADLCYVSSLHDGMNLVAKEFVAARDDERGVLVLSHFTGAARELTEALVVNPYDIQQASSALATALRLPEQEQRARMHAMRGLVAEFNVYRWAGRMLADAARLRRRERLNGTLTETLAGMEPT